MDDVDVLLIEDNQGDVHLIEWAFRERCLPGTLHAVHTGAQALDWLHRRGEFSDASPPDLVLLDLNLPATSGHAMLEEIKSDHRLRRVPVIILTGSRSKDDIVRAYDNFANAYLVKPVDTDEFAALIQSTIEFWTTSVVLPPRSGVASERTKGE